MRVYIDLDTLTLIESPGARSPVDTLRFKRGTQPKLELQFVRDGEPELLPSGSVIRFGPKEEGKYDGEMLVFTDEFTDPATVDDFYIARPSFNTDQINDALASPDGNDANDIESITLMAEFSWRLGGDLPEKTQTFEVVVDNAVDSGDEAAPSEAGPSLDTRISALEERIDQMGGVLLVHPDGTSDFYEAAADTDTARGTALLSAVTASVDGDVIRLGAGIYDVGTSAIDLPDGVSLRGLGSRATSLTGNVGLSVVGPYINPGSNSVLADFSSTVATDSALRGHIGAKNSQSAFENVVIQNVICSGGSDGFYISNVAGTFSAKIYNCVFETSYDNLVAASVTATIEAWNTRFSVTGAHDADTGGEGNTAVYASGAAVLKLTACELHAEEGLSGPAKALKTFGGTASVTLHACTVECDGVNNIICTDGSTVSVAATTYDPSQVSGAITIADASVIRGALDADAASARDSLGASSGVWPVSLGGTGVSSVPKFSVHKNNVNQSVADSTDTLVTWSTEAFDDGAWFDTTGGKATPKVAGKYQFMVSVMPLGAADGTQVRAILYKNGSPLHRLGNMNAGAGAANPQVGGTVLVEANGSTDYFEVFFRQESGGSLDIFGQAIGTFWMGALIP